MCCGVCQMLHLQCSEHLQGQRPNPASASRRRRRDVTWCVGGDSRGSMPVVFVSELYGVLDGHAMSWLAEKRLHVRTEYICHGVVAAAVTAYLSGRAPLLLSLCTAQRAGEMLLAPFILVLPTLIVPQPVPPRAWRLQPGGSNRLWATGTAALQPAGAWPQQQPIKISMHAAGRAGR